MSELLNKCTAARDAAQKMVRVSSSVKDKALLAIADALRAVWTRFLRRMLWI